MTNSFPQLFRERPYYVYISPGLFVALTIQRIMDGTHLLR